MKATHFIRLGDFALFVKKRIFSIVFLLAITSLAAFVLAIYKWQREYVKWSGHIAEAIEWSNAPRGNSPRIFIFEVDGKEYGISTTYMISDGEGWVSTNQVLSNEYFAYPPGVKVRSIAKAFDIFKERSSEMSETLVREQ